MRRFVSYGHNESNIAKFRLLIRGLSLVKVHNNLSGLEALQMPSLRNEFYQSPVGGWGKV